MRENWARLIVLITGVLVVLLSMLFARIQNPDKPSLEEAKPTTAPATTAPDAKQYAQGEGIFQQQGCAGCHSIKGKGNQRNPLDGVAKKYTDKELRDWMTGAETLEGQMTHGIMKLKSKYQKLPKEDLDALVEYLKSQD